MTAEADIDNPKPVSNDKVTYTSSVTDGSGQPISCIKRFYGGYRLVVDKDGIHKQCKTSFMP
ncbi:hypothetical protein [Paenibacillus sp. A3M_27_13]|uniref:hypothetical protein n=1 Tax=Paenibacillus sp. A3M_27_13 TaxID=2962029 RepID=UPI0020B765E3|nr:hypothetical protein [Paenibacillus sp. A3M_27_13]MCP3746599.1 hypothetical protein [Paenibacillus sp. A3M_27_13]